MPPSRGRSEKERGIHARYIHRYFRYHPFGFGNLGGRLHSGIIRATASQGFMDFTGSRFSGHRLDHLASGGSEKQISQNSFKNENPLSARKRVFYFSLEIEYENLEPRN